MDDIMLVNFAPLIHLWAGICLLFFYEPILKNFPLSKLHEEKQNLIVSFLGKYQAYLDDEKLMKGYKMLEDKWDIFYQTIKNLASLNFYFSLVVLAYIGIESHNYYGTYYQALQILDYCIIIYSLMAWIFYKTNVFVKYINSIVFIIILLVVFHNYSGINDFFIKNIGIIDDFYSKSEITVFTLFTCSLCIIITILQLFIHYISIYNTKRKIEKIHKNAMELNAILIGEKSLDTLKGELKNKSLCYLTKDEFPKTIYEFQSKMNEFIKKEIQEEFDRLILHWYQLPLRYVKRKFNKIIIPKWRKE